MQKPRIGLIGLGAMGAPMASNLLQAGYQLTVGVHQRREAAEQLALQGAIIAESYQALGENSDIVITMVPDAPQVEAALLGTNGAAYGMAAGSICIDMSTIAPTASRAIAAKLAERQIAMLDAPVSGGPARAKTGELAIMVGGEPSTFERCQAVLEVLGGAVSYIGASGSGSVVKLCNNLAISIIAMANIEALAFGVANGVEAETIRNVLLNATASNYLLERWLPETVFSGDYNKGFAAELLAKDLNAVLDTARASGVPLWAGGLAQQMWIAQKALDPRSDYTALAQRYEAIIGRTIKPNSE
ncbi:MAG TPA: NAD(P)-dependent oxidoreductase [Herpetosiphon sp.]|uniref:3-hydroxyisobutyrate dehydrogenase n=1 Tax=Herpetosiphon aurantiacus (strain ATCC 23779 / DSM 785 / 114-95) TaxID=316274 RepID=A9AUM3_HERA2|nr:NAD(P)-dependent oxidoreductase [Herpetosiphon sp.]ABX04550.1 3-hydroxyisobutyrate dehydrogenase [Herpetosiphon aurantiacus DSM 785]HBW50021.1 NAD(P)-dependent oxidoreductase [Herpetosiphon sp.]